MNRSWMNERRRACRYSFSLQYPTIPILVWGLLQPVIPTSAQMVPSHVVGWGDNRFGQTKVPTRLTGVIAIAAGDFYSLALKHDGTVVAWGSNLYGQTTVPHGLIGVSAIAAGGAHSLALIMDRTPTVTATPEAYKVFLPEIAKPIR